MRYPVSSYIDKCSYYPEAQVMMESLPTVPLLLITKYLKPEDITRLALTCKRFHEVLPRFLRFRGDDFEITGPYGGDFAPEFYFDGPVLTAIVRSFKSSVHWKDQGWGNRKGQILVKLMRPKYNAKNSDKSVEIAKNRNLFGIAEHEWKTCSSSLVDDPIVKLAQAGDYYRFIRNAGGGGGHDLFVKNFTVLLELNKD